jgi:transcriptional regulator with XRE-family HTH domain
VARKSRGPVREPVGIGRLLREYREARGFTQGELASRAGITQSAVSQIESGVRPNPNIMTLRLLEEALGDPPVRLAYELVMPQRAQASLERFLGTSMAQELQISPEEVEDLKRCVWFGEGEDPSDEAWRDFVTLRRRVRHGKL